MTSGTLRRPLALNVLPGMFCIARLPPEAGLPAWARSSSWLSVTRTADELSIVCESRVVPEAVERNGPWRLLQIEGPLDFALTGILNRITGPLADAAIALFAVSTFDTDYVLVRGRDLDAAILRLRSSGLIVRAPD